MQHRDNDAWLCHPPLQRMRLPAGPERLWIGPPPPALPQPSHPGCSGTWAQARPRRGRPGQRCGPPRQEHPAAQPRGAIESESQSKMQGEEEWPVRGHWEVEVHAPCNTFICCPLGRVQPGGAIVGSHLLVGWSLAPGTTVRKRHFEGSKGRH